MATNIESRLPLVPRPGHDRLQTSHAQARSADWNSSTLSQAQRAILYVIFDGQSHSTFTILDPVSPNLCFGLDQVDTLTRLNTGSPFTELSSELQQAVLALISTRDLTTPDVDLALWLENLRLTSASQPAGGRSAIEHP